MVKYVPVDQKQSEQTREGELKRILLSELIDGEVVVGAALLSQNGIPIVYHIPNTLTVKSLKNIISLYEFISHAARISDDLLGPFQYLVIRYSNFKIAFFEIRGRGWLMIFVNPVWHVENVLTKIKQFMLKVARLL